MIEKENLHQQFYSLLFFVVSSILSFLLFSSIRLYSEWVTDWQSESVFVCAYVSCTYGFGIILQKVQKENTKVRFRILVDV